MPLSVADGDILEFVTHAFYNGVVECDNVFHYHVSAAGGATLNQFGAGLRHYVIAEVQNVVTTIMEWFDVDCRILDTDGVLVNGEFYVLPAGTGLGQISAEALPPENCITFKYIRPSSSFRHGYKRFAGISEGSQANGVPVSGFLTGLATLATALETPIHAWTIDPTTGAPAAVISGATAHPVVLQRIINGDPISPVNVADITDVVFDKLGTQNTRKFGRGS